MQSKFSDFYNHWHGSPKTERKEVAEVAQILFTGYSSAENNKEQITNYHPNMIFSSVIMLFLSIHLQKPQC